MTADMQKEMDVCHAELARLGQSFARLQTQTDALRADLELLAPMADVPSHRRQWIAYVTAVAKRMHAGAAAYGNRSFERPPHEIAAEVREEAADALGWGFLLWNRIGGILPLITPAPPEPRDCGHGANAVQIDAEGNRVCVTCDAIERA